MADSLHQKLSRANEEHVESGSKFDALIEDRARQVLDSINGILRTSTDGGPEYWTGPKPADPDLAKRTFTVPARSQAETLRILGRAMELTDSVAIRQVLETATAKVESRYEVHRTSPSPREVASMMMERFKGRHEKTIRDNGEGDPKLAEEALHEYRIMLLDLEKNRGDIDPLLITKELDIVSLRLALLQRTRQLATAAPKASSAKKDQQLQKDRAECDSFLLTHGVPGVLSKARKHDAMAKELLKTRGGIYVYFDLNGFKAFNDNRGHHLGDLALVAISASVMGKATASRRKIAKGLPEVPADFLNVVSAVERALESEPPFERRVHFARDGGDEFVAFFPGAAPQEEQDCVAAIVRRFNIATAALDREFPKTNGGPAASSLHAGFGVQHIALAADAGAEQAEASLRDARQSADELMYKTKPLAIKNNGNGDRFPYVTADKPDTVLYIEQGTH